MRGQSEDKRLQSLLLCDLFHHVADRWAYRKLARRPRKAVVPHSLAARSNSAMSSFFIPIMACIAFGSSMSSVKRAGTICQQPNLSLRQLHAISLPIWPRPKT